MHTRTKLPCGWFFRELHDRGQSEPLPNDSEQSVQVSRVWDRSVSHVVLSAEGVLEAMNCIIWAKAWDIEATVGH
jgi:hypothetical protein